MGKRGGFYYRYDERKRVDVWKFSGGEIRSPRRSGRGKKFHLKYIIFDWTGIRLGNFTDLVSAKEVVWMLFA